MGERFKGEIQIKMSNSKNQAGKRMAHTTDKHATTRNARPPSLLLSSSLLSSLLSSSEDEMANKSGTGVVKSRWLVQRSSDGPNDHCIFTGEGVQW